MRRVTALVALAMVLIGLLLLYLLANATNSGEMYEQNYAQLFTINLVVAGVLAVLIAWAAWRLYQRVRQGRFGSRLLLKIATIFALVGVAPGLLIYVVSLNFVSRSIETWFDVKVEGALDAGLSLGRVTLDTLSNDFASKARVAADQLSENQQMVQESVLLRLMEQIGASDAAVWSASGKLLASAGSIGIQLSPDKPNSTQLRAAKTERSYAWVDGLEDAAMGKAARPSIKALVPIPNASLGLASEQRFLLVQRILPANFVANALAVDSANREYQERALGRSGLKRMYIGTLTLSLFLAVFGAILLAMVLGNQIARPLLVLTEGVSQVAAGDLRPKFVLQSNDELGGLTRAFASMTQQLADARQTVQTSIVQLDAARARLQTILDNLTSGVLVLNAAGAVRSVNPGAARILQQDVAQLLGSRIADLPGLEAFGQGIAQQFDDFLQGSSEGGNDHWQQSFELGVASVPAGSMADRSRMLVARGAILPDASRLVVFDDISEIVSAQRARAWGEVARRLAHEIKNPLTPIQLSAERLERRLTGKLEAAEQQVLAKSVKTIVEQVDAMKRLVNDFRDYARLPAAQLEAVDLNELVDGVLHLYESSPIPIRLELEAGIPAVLGDPQQLRQVLHNLLQNGLDATTLKLEEAVHSPHGLAADATELVVRTQFTVNSGRVRLIILDQGGGFPEHILKRAFEPYVTTKRSGTGLGLAVVKKIADDHGGRIEISNRMSGASVLGAQVSLSLGCVANVKNLENTISGPA
ncbi:MAG: HAMP domain-containing protein [Rhodoferax sp.]|nr:HAMP domain-containing protein [Rhodoferax sp.]